MPESSQYAQPASDIAVIGMAGFFPDAPDVGIYWQNTIKGLVAIDEVPAERWDWRYYYDSDRQKPDRINSKWGAFLPDIVFDPLYFGIPPKALPFIETSQLLLLESTRLALDDAGYLERSFDRRRTAVFIGTGAGEGDLGQQYSFRSMLPRFFGESADDLLNGLDGAVPEWREDVFTGIIMNIAAGRIADRFNFGGTNCTIDAACASALAALRAGILELKAGESDLVIAGGADTLMSPYAYTCFSKVGALSGTGRSIPFDENADGIVLGECVATVVLKRLADAERDGDIIYAVIKGIGASSDGRGKGLTVPKPEGQIAAISRAYENAGIDPATIDLIEAHGTSTRAGDRSEAAALKSFFSQTGMPARTCAVGSVKSMIGHTKCAAGIASLMKTVLALHHKILPPTAGVEHPLADLDGAESPLYLNTKARPWVSTSDSPRRAGVSAFGFGGTNFHAVLEAYEGAVKPDHWASPLPDWDTELLVFREDSSEALAATLHAVVTQLTESPAFALKDLAYTLAMTESPKENVRLAIVAASLDDARAKMETALDALDGTKEEYDDSTGIYFSRVPVADTGKVAFVYPGQGSQYTYMLNDLCMAFPLVREVVERFDRHLRDRFPTGLSRAVYPPPPFTAEEKKANEKVLTQTRSAQAAMGAVDTAMHTLLTHLGATPDMVAGHSYGEYPALFAAGVLEEDELARISEARGRFILESATPEPGTMAAVKASETTVAPLLENIDGVWIANLNAPLQTVISGTQTGVQTAMDRLGKEGVVSKQIPVSCAFHSPIVDGARSRLAEMLDGCTFAPQQIPVYSNTIADCFPEAAADIKALLVKQLVHPVRFVSEIEAMYAKGVRTFVEVGAGSVLTNLIRTILKGKTHQSVATDKKNGAGLTRLQHALAVLILAGQRLQLGRLYQGRQCRRLDLKQSDAHAFHKPPGKGAYVIGGGTVRPVDQAPREAVVPRPVVFSDIPPVMPATGAAVHSPGIGRDHNNMNVEQFDGDTMGSSFNQNQSSMSREPRTGETTTDETVISRFQDLMSQFLETQKAVMTAYLNGTVEMPDHRAEADAVLMQDPQAAATAGMTASPTFSGETAEPEAELASADKQENTAVDSAALASDESAATCSRGAVDLKSLLLDIVSDCTGYPVDMLEMDQEIEADLGIDSIKRMQAMEELEVALEKKGLRLPEDQREQLLESLTLADLLAGLESMVTGNKNTQAADSPATQVSGAATVGHEPASAVSEKAGALLDVAGMLMNVVSDLSGYPVDMLEPEQEIDADLGIDSIKRMQILEHMESDFEAYDIKLSDQDREQLAESLTLGDIITVLTDLTGSAGGSLQPENNVALSKDDAIVRAEASATEASPAADTAAKIRQMVTERLYHSVETHTGYPAEMLAPDLKLGAELQMDAAMIENVSNDCIGGLEKEISGFRTEVETKRPVPLSALGDIVDWLVKALVSAAGGITEAIALLDQEMASDIEGPSDKEPSAADAIRRFTLVAKERPLIPSADDRLQAATILLTRVADEPVAAAVIRTLQASGRRMVVLTHKAEVRPGQMENRNDSDPVEYVIDFSDSEALAGIIEDIRNTHGPVAGLLHLTPLAAGESFADMDLEIWKNEVAVKVKSLFHLTRGVYKDLNAAVEMGGGSVVAALAMGGTFASIPMAGSGTSEAPLFSSVSGGVCGFLKALAEEMTGLNIRLVDNDPQEKPETIAAQVVSELLTLSADIEVGYHQGARLVLDIQEAPLAMDDLPDNMIDSESCLLLTGGARGITAAIALELASRFKPTLLLVGRTPFVETEADNTAGITDEKQLKAILAERLKAGQKKVRPIDLEDAYHRLTGQREIRNTLEQLRAAGASAHYLACDVTDIDGFSNLIASIYEKFGRIDGVIHGAGHIEDKRIKDKDTDSFDRVFDTKADSLFILGQALRTEQLRFMALFSSVAGRFGNAGQSDYGAANEVYNKTALYLNRLWPGRVVSFIWGPWESQGMVSAELQEKFNQSGITLISRKVGTGCFVNEMLYGKKADTEVVFGGWDDRKKVLSAARRSAGLPLLSLNANFYPSRNGNVALVRRVDTGVDRYLEDHKLDGRPVMPMAMALEMMAEAVAYRYSDFKLSAFTDIHVLRGIVLNNGTADILITVDPVEKESDRVTLAVRIRDSHDSKRLYYRANAELVREQPTGDTHHAIGLNDPGPFSLSVAEAYDKRLFHGPLWRGIQDIETIGKNGIIGRLKRSTPSAYLHKSSSADTREWLIDPLVIDSGLQLVVLWMREQMNATPLPSRLDRFMLFDTPKNGDSLRCEVRVNVPDNGGLKSADLFFVKPDGMLAGVMEGLEIIGSESLNRLAEK
ncbi:MAG: SDR family NAD(P)-dependent oxidoreductase [Thermodesulfobacteriota bacterium]|nr:SDR family NAD(P)-dependent oxidoreductase [Thermodesulfobacteriota bacterium]